MVGAVAQFFELEGFKSVMAIAGGFPGQGPAHWRQCLIRAGVSGSDRGLSVNRGNTSGRCSRAAGSGWDVGKIALGW